MAVEFVWLLREFPWLGHGFIHAVAESHADQFTRQLTGLGFTVATMRCGAGDDLHAQLAKALNFPEYYGRNWDAFDECILDIEVPHPFALIWRHAESYAAAEPKLFGEASAVLRHAFDVLGERAVQAVLVITGNGAAFRSPDSAST